MIWMRRTRVVYLAAVAVSVSIFPMLSGLPEYRLPAWGIGVLLFTFVIYQSIPLYRYTPKTGELTTGSTAILLFADSIAILSCAFLTTVALDALWLLNPEHKTLIGLEPDWVGGTRITGIHFVTLPGLTLGIPFFTFFTTATFDQKLCFKSESISSTGVFGGTKLKWDEIVSVQLKELRSVAQIAASDYRPIEKVLELEAEQESIVIHQPSSRSKKQQILQLLEKHLRPELQSKLPYIGDKW